MSEVNLVGVVDGLDVDFGDVLNRSQLLDLFQIEPVVYGEDQDAVAMVGRKEAADWEYFRLVEQFKELMRERRGMHLKNIRGTGEYRILRPEEHATEAVEVLRTKIEKGFNQAQAILESTRADLLDAVDRARLDDTKVRTAQLESMFRSGRSKNFLKH